MSRNLIFPLLLLTGVFLLAMQDSAFASAGTGGSLPYEDWLDKIRMSVTGPVAFAVAVIGIVVAGAILIFGGDLNSFFRTFVLIVLVMGFLVGAQNVMATLFGKSATLAEFRQGASLTVHSSVLIFLTVLGWSLLLRPKDFVRKDCLAPEHINP